MHAIVDEVEFDGAFQPAGDGRHYLLLSKRLLRQIGARPGEVIEMRFSIANQDEVDVPDDVRWALPPAAQRAFAALTPGKRRAVLVPVAGARTTATRQKRIAALLRGLIDGTLITGPPNRMRT